MSEDRDAGSDAAINDPYSHHLGISFESVSDGTSELHMEVTEEHLNGNGTLHGGAIFSLADAAGGAALNSLWTDDTGVALEANISFLAPAERGDTIIGRAEVTQERRKTAEMTISIELDDGTKIASSRARGYKVS